MYTVGIVETTFVKKHIRKGTKKEKERLSSRFARLEVGHAPPQAHPAAFVFCLKRAKTWIQPH